VLPIGGLKEKALAAQRNDIHCVIAPALNERDIEDIPEHLRNDLEFLFVEEIGEVLPAALEPRPRPTGAGARVQRQRAGYRIATRTASDVWR
jgi:ATP-dependent Lon protease